MHITGDHVLASLEARQYSEIKFPNVAEEALAWGYSERTAMSSFSAAGSTAASSAASQINTVSTKTENGNGAFWWCGSPPHFHVSASSSSFQQHQSCACPTTGYKRRSRFLSGIKVLRFRMKSRKSVLQTDAETCQVKVCGFFEG